MGSANSDETHWSSTLLLLLIDTASKSGDWHEHPTVY